jgi:hypothetical protein
VQARQKFNLSLFQIEVEPHGIVKASTTSRGIINCNQPGQPVVVGLMLAQAQQTSPFATISTLVPHTTVCPLMPQLAILKVVDSAHLMLVQQCFL